MLTSFVRSSIVKFVSSQGGASISPPSEPEFDTCEFRAGGQKDKEECAEFFMRLSVVIPLGFSHNSPANVIKTREVSL